MIEVSTSELHKAVEALHGCKATRTGTEAVSEEFDGKPVWQASFTFSSCTAIPRPSEPMHGRRQLKEPSGVSSMRC
jgi:hypothetical protein